MRENADQMMQSERKPRVAAVLDRPKLMKFVWSLCRLL